MKKAGTNGLLYMFTFFLFFVLACSPQKRLNRLLKHHPELKRDTTVTVYDTTFIPQYSFDTIYNFKNSHDTIFMVRNNYSVKVFQHNDSIFIGANVKADTIYKEIKVPFTKIINTTDNRKVWQMFWAGIASVLFLLVLIWLVLKWIKPI